MSLTSKMPACITRIRWKETFWRGKKVKREWEEVVKVTGHSEGVERAGMGSLSQPGAWQYPPPALQTMAPMSPLPLAA